MAPSLSPWEDSAPGRSRQRPEDLDPFPRRVPLAPLPFPLFPFPKPGKRSVLHRRCVRTHPQPKHQPSPQYWWWPHWRQNLKIRPFLTLGYRSIWGPDESESSSQLPSLSKPKSDMSDTSSQTLPRGSSQTFFPFCLQGPLPLPFSYHV